MFGNMVAVRKLVFYFSGRHHDHHLRSYGTVVNGDTITSLLEATAKGTNLSGGAFGQIAPNLMQPNAQSEGVALIDNGWGNGRLCFNAVIQVTSDFSSVTQNMLVSGYTDRPGVSVGQNGQPIIDRSMRLFFNSITELQTVNALSNTQQVYEQTLIANTSQLLRPTHGVPALGVASNEFSMRPADVMFVAGSAHMSQMGMTNVYDFRATLNDGMKLSARSNQRPAEYLSRTVKQYSAASLGNESTELDIASLTDQAAGTLHDGSVSQNKFFSRLANEGSLGNLATGCSVTYQELCDLDPNTDNVAICPTPQAMMRVDGGYATIEGHQGLGGADITSVAANTVGQVLPALMAEFKCGRLAFRATNNVVLGGGNRFEITPLNVQGFADQMDMSGYIPPLLTYIENEILNVISHGNNISLNIAVDSELNGSTTVKISLGNGPLESFSNATYADQLFSPVMTTNYNRLTNMAVDIQNLGEEIASAQYQYRGNVAQVNSNLNDIFGGLNANPGIL